MSRGSIFLISYLIVGIPLFGLSALTYISNPKLRVNKSISLMGLASALWLMLLFFSDYKTDSYSVFLDNLTLAGGYLISTSYFAFARSVITYEKILTKTFVVIVSLMTLITLANFMIPGFVGHRVPVNDAHTFKGSYGYFAHVLLTFGVLIHSTFHVYQKSKKASDKDAYRKYKILVQGGAVGIGLNLIAELVFVVFDILTVDNSIAYNLTCAAGVLYFACSASYAVLKFGLFDARRAVVLGLGYSISIVFIALSYGIFLSIINNSLISKNDGILELVTGGLLVVLVALTFPLIKQFFDHLSKRLFFRNSYDTSTVLGELNDLFIAQPKLHPILTKSLKIIGDSLHPTFAELYAVERYNSYGRAAIGTAAHKKKVALSRFLNAPWPVNNLIVINSPHSTASEKDYLNNLKAELMLRLSTKDIVVGYLMLGPKKNGDKYTDQDVKLLKIIAKNLSLAIQSAMQYTKIQKFNDTLQAEIASATKDLRKTNNKLKKLSQAKDEMISMVSHQLIPQLTATRGFMELMENSTSNKSELLKLSRSSTARMTRMAQDMLNSTKIQAGEFRLDLENVDLVKLIKGEIDNLSYASQKHKTKINFNHPDSCILSVDPVKLQEAIFNLLDNAIQYSLKDSEIEVVLTSESIKIVDHGIGIPKDEQKQLFSKFFRASNAKEKRPSGSGIGLFVSSQILYAHGFTISLKSNTQTGTKVLIDFGSSKVKV